MRLLPSFLLLLLLPGLLLPAGLLLRLCRCAEMQRATASCCVATAPEAVASTCCAHRVHKDDGEGERERTPAAAAKPACGCVWIAPNEHKPEPVPPCPDVPAVPPVLPVHRAAVPPGAAAPTEPPPPVEAARPPPPPDRQRNLPLRS